MINNIRPYHFTKQVGKNFKDFFEQVVSCDGIVCFDWEDSVSSERQDQIATLKNMHRRSIVDGLLAMASDINWMKIGLRINGIATPFYRNDIEAISSLDSIHCVFVPKIESGRDVEKVLMEMPRHVEEIIPIVETQAGLRNIESIMSIKDARLKRLAFGHCDFNLSNHYFPFFHQDSEHYWLWMESLDGLAIKAGMAWINSPVLRLNEDLYFQQILSKNKSYKTITGQVTLSLKQTLLCKEDITCQQIELHQNKCEDVLKQAMQTIERFEKYKLDQRFFAIDENRVLISPQEYMQAKEIVKNSMR